MRLHIIRHGDPDYPNDNLTDLGKREAQALARRMERLPLVRICSSPMGRALATARYTADRTGIPVQTLEWIREMGELTANPHSSVLPDPVVIWNLPGHQLHKAEGGKENQGANSDLFPQPQTANRFRELHMGWLEWLRQAHIQVTDEGWTADAPLAGNDVAIFCHHGSGLALLSLIMDIPVAALWRSIWLPPTSVSTVLLEQYDKHRINPRLVCIGDTSHLSSEGLDNNTSGLLYNIN
ncbi:probable phosphoglycerate mutase [Paenibacillus sp. UNCCL117]|uniref:histidine phosphatase family protein n=1 Tax=unclassified Paenibacillus TaxID=185978 RepID=UPI00088EFFF0|nr:MULTISPECIES: histidine phosphatase family protein [unclassified Paenibacillus]SDE06472.1 probable phosphoglycerate mutase [Paenibacillus sp. cl123]SFW59406.1 probable phosphoglycerate mutase [Paenibacillus sp. UNCCL117]